MQEQEKNSLEIRPFGEVTLGLVDPRSLAEEQFKNSENILYHVTARRDFKFDDNHDYKDKLHPNSDYSSTIGNGFYTTDNLEVSEIIKSERGDGAKIVEFLPWNAKMLDLRSPDNLKNEKLSLGFFESFRKFVNNKRKEERNQEILYNNHSDLASFLNDYFFNKCKNGYVPIDLRQMLGMGNSSYSERYCNTFTEFMLSQGYDGLIYLEGTDGDKTGKVNCPSIVFYNPKVIGTYESWQKRKDQD